MLPQVVHSRIFSLASRMASARASASRGGQRSKWKARRCAVFCPIPGKCFSSSMRRSTGAAKSGMTLCSTPRLYGANWRDTAGLVGGGEALEVGRRDADGVENFLETGHQFLRIDVLQVAGGAVANGSDAIADFVAGFIGEAMQVDARVLVHAGDGGLFGAAKNDAVDGAVDARAAKFRSDVQCRAGFGIGVVERADGEKFVDEVGTQENAGRRLDGGETHATFLGEVHRHWAEVAEAAIAFGEFAFLEQIAFGSVERDAVFFVGKSQRAGGALRHLFDGELAAGRG